METTLSSKNPPLSMIYRPISINTISLGKTSVLRTNFIILGMTCNVAPNLKKNSTMRLSLGTKIESKLCVMMALMESPFLTSGVMDLLSL